VVSVNSRTRSVIVIFGILLVVTIAGIRVHQYTGYNYPVSSPAASFELNVLGDIYEAAVLVPLGVAGIMAMGRGKRWGNLLVTGVTIHFTYNYAMSVTGRQNLWIFVWIAKLALSGIVMCLVWPLLPTGTGLTARSRRVIVAYLVLVVLVFSGLMGQRLWASAMGRAVDMTMQHGGAADWGDPVLRDPVVFLSLVVPVMVAGILGLARGTEWGGRAAAVSCAFAVSIVSVVIFTGPLKELLMTVRISPPMLGMSSIMLLVAAVAAWALVQMSRSEASANDIGE
jgi:hypothetical protein